MNREILFNLTNVDIKNLISLDVETTGFTAGRDEILSLSIVGADGNKRFNSLIRPDILKRWEQSVRIHGITPEDVRDIPNFAAFRDEVQSIIDSASALVIYNAPFDISFLESAGIQVPNIPVFDMMRLFAPVYGESGAYGKYKWQKLTTCARYYHYRWGKAGAHSSLEDAKATIYCFMKYRDELMRKKI